MKLEILGQNSDGSEQNSKINLDKKNFTNVVKLGTKNFDISNTNKNKDSLIKIDPTFNLLNSNKTATLSIFKMFSSFWRTLAVAIAFLSSKINNNISLAIIAYRNDFDRNWYKLNKVNDMSLSTITNPTEDGWDEFYFLMNVENSMDDAYRIKANNRDQGSCLRLNWTDNTYFRCTPVGESAIEKDFGPCYI